MNRWLDIVSVGGVVLAGCLYSLAALGPRSLKKRLGATLAAALRRLPAGLGVRGLAGRLAASGLTGGSCGGCDNCATDDSPSGAAAPAEVRIPLSTIGKRR